MPIETLRAENFRCFEAIEFNADPRFNLIYGANASGKTSLLEALAYLGRGKSFRSAPVSALVRHGASEFVLFGRAQRGAGHSSIGIRNSASGREVRVDGVSGVGSGVLAEALPMQIIDPDVHNLVAGGPDERRQYLDWVAFHVERDFLDHWRRFRRALKQRNAALRAGGAGLAPWDAEFAELGETLNASRQAALAVCTEALERQGQALLGSAVRFEYRPGWNTEEPLAAAIEAGRERDLQQGSSQQGPHRADLRLILDERQAKKLVSRGQQKLLACSMILAAAEVVQARLGRPMLLLLDDPAAELDRESLSRLMRQVFELECQVVVATLDEKALSFPEPPTVFHVEHGALTRRP